MDVLFESGNGARKIKIEKKILKIAKTIYIFAIRF